MMVPPLSERPVTEEDEERFREECAPRRYTLRRRWADYRSEAKRTRPKGARARAQAWLHVEPFYWTMRVVYVCLAAGAVFAVYINGVAEGWWRAWGEKPSVAATAPAAQPTPAPSLSSEAAMSGGYQIGPDGVLVRPAEFAADTYTKPELPEEAKENTERGAELAAEYVVETLTYAWNTGDTQPFADITEAGVRFHDSTIDSVNTVYRNGWVYGNTSSITGILSVEPITDSKWGAQPDSIGVIFKVATTNGTACMGQRIVVSDSPFDVRVVLFMTWKEGRWIATEGSISNYEEK